MVQGFNVRILRSGNSIPEDGEGVAARLAGLILLVAATAPGRAQFPTVAFILATRLNRCLALDGNALGQSGRGLPQSKTWRKFERAFWSRKRLGVRQSSGAFSTWVSVEQKYHYDIH
ncbi:MAG: hypothetical protein JWQ04_2569 [Pedosphaera sp.]|nr:hypothetical protein [Pedosphaera sp.]